ncbi:MAG: tyrosine-type recombinase/integrase [Prevotellaceae bacterium]|jgi:integrase/recombinase XerC|nr:tyrosine-type recombinase/integrase [Prevotellaceae bacterium]
MYHRFINYLRHEKRYSERTTGIYAGAIQHFLGHAAVDGSDKEALAALTAQEVRSWMSDMLKSQLATRTVNLQLTALNRFFKFLLTEKILKKNPMQKIQRPKTSKRLPEFFSANALNDFLNRDVAGDDYICVRDRMIIDLFYTTGIRRAELITLRPADIYITSTEAVLRVTGKGDKQRETPLTEEITGQLKNYLTLRQTTFPDLADNDSLFVTGKGKPLYPIAVSRLVHDRLANQQGFTGKKSPHVLRHSLATHLLNNGADIMSIKETLGHSSLAATQVYTHNSFAKLKKVYTKAHPRAKEKNQEAEKIIKNSEQENNSSNEIT